VNCFFDVSPSPSSTLVSDLHHHLNGCPIKLKCRSRLLSYPPPLHAFRADTASNFEALFPFPSGQKPPPFNFHPPSCMNFLCPIPLSLGCFLYSLPFPALVVIKFPPVTLPPKLLLPPPENVIPSAAVPGPRLFFPRRLIRRRLQTPSEITALQCRARFPLPILPYASFSPPCR